MIESTQHAVSVYLAFFEPELHRPRLARNPHMLRIHCMQRVADLQRHGEWPIIIAALAKSERLAAARAL